MDVNGVLGLARILFYAVVNPFGGSGSINVWTGSIRFPAARIGIPLFAGVLGISSLEWQGIVGSFSLLGGLFLVLTVEGLSLNLAIAAPPVQGGEGVLVAGASRGRDDGIGRQQHGAQTKQVGWWSRYAQALLKRLPVNVSVTCNNAKAALDEAVALHLLTLQVKYRNAQDGRVEISVENAAVRCFDEEVDADDEGGGGQSSLLSVASAQAEIVIGAEGARHSATAAVGAIALSMAPAQHDALLSAVRRVCRQLTPSVAALKGHFSAQMQAFFEGLDALDARRAGAGAVPPPSPMNELLYFDATGAARGQGLVASPASLKWNVAVTIESITLLLGAPLRELEGFLRLEALQLDMLGEADGSARRTLHVADVLQLCPSSGRMRSCIVDEQGAFVVGGRYGRWLEVGLRTNPADEATLQAVVLPSRMCVDICDLCPLLFLAKEVSQSVAAASAARACFGPPPFGSRVGRRSIASLWQGVDARCDSFRLDIMSANLAMGEAHPLLAFSVHDLHAAQDSHSSHLEVEVGCISVACGLSETLRVDQVKLAVPVPSRAAAEAAFRPPAAWEAGSVCHWLDQHEELLAANCTVLGIEAVRLHAVPSDLENLGYLEGALQEVAIASPAYVSSYSAPEHRSSLREIIFPALLSPSSFACTLGRVELDATATWWNEARRGLQTVRYELEVSGPETAPATAEEEEVGGGEEGSRCVLRYRADSVGGGIVTRSELTLHSTLSLVCLASSVSAEGKPATTRHLLCSLTPQPSPLQQSLAFPSELYAGARLSHQTAQTLVAAVALALNIDIETIGPVSHLLCRRATASKAAREDIRALFDGLPSRLYYLDPQFVDGPTARACPVIVQSQPSSVLSVTLASVELRMSHELRNVFVLSTAEAEVDVVKYDGMSQVCGFVSSLRLSENTMESAIHKFIIHDLDPQDPSVVEFHLSSLGGESPLLELRADHLRALYNQRSTMTLVTFLRDHFFPSLAKAKKFSAHFHGANEEEVSPLLRRLVSAAKQVYIPVRAAAAAPQQPFGMLRFSVSAVQSEFHLPTNSCGNDALVAVIANVICFKSDPNMQAVDASYCPGPYISKGLWLAETDNVQKVMGVFARHDWFLEGDVAATRATWKMPTHALPALTASNQLPRGCSEFLLDVEVTDSMICNWCNQNPVGENLNVFVTVSFKPAVSAPAADGLYSEVLLAQGFRLQPSAVRNTVKVDVRLDFADATLAQGQYMTIVNMIQQNFMEQQVVVPDLFVLPVPKTVHLGEAVYGVQSLETRLPLISTIPIHVKSGKVTFVENLPDYYELLGRVTLAHSLPKEKEGGKNGGRSQASPGTALTASLDTIPAWSHHRAHRNKLFARLPLSARLLRPTGLSKMSLGGNQIGSQPHDRSNSFYQSSAQPFYGEPLICIHFLGLEVDFYRYHYGGGNGIFVSAHTFVITAESGADGQHVDDDDDGDDEDEAPAVAFASHEYFARIPAQRFLFAPKKMMEEATPVQATGDGDAYADAEATPHIIYRQQGNGNLRRCVVELSDSIAINHLLPITAAVRYFVEPIQLTSMRNLGLIEKRKVGPFDFKAALDVEVHARSTVFCLPNISANKKEVSSGLCLHGDFSYTQAWRGFLNVGPGKITQIFKLEISSIFIVPLREIRVSGAESLIDPCHVQFTTEFMIVPDDENGDRNRALIAPWINLSPAWSEKRVANNGKPSGIRLMALEVSKEGSAGLSEEEEEEDGVEWVTLEDKVEKEEKSLEQSSTQVRVSLKDLMFVQSAIMQLNEAIAAIPSRQPVAEKYFPLYNTRRDLDHLPMLTHYLLHTPLTEKWVMRNNDVIADICSYRAILRNNTYNIRIAKINLTGIRFSYNHSLDHLHMAAGLVLSVWTHNELVDKWEPVIESVSMNAIGATDTSSKDASGANRTRIDVFCEPLEIDFAESAMSGLVRKLNLADVVTTSSARLPPYRICNDLGLAVHIEIGIDGVKAVSERILHGDELPIEARRLSLAAARYHRIGPISSPSGPGEEKEHLLNISFDLGSETYQSRVPVAIDREGLFAFDLRNKNPAVQARAAASKNSDTPFAMVNMSIKEDGGREILLRSMLNMRNQTARMMYVSVRLGVLSAEATIAPGNEWNVPVSLAFPQASLFLRFDDRSEWFQALRTLKSLVLHGTWSAPSRLAAELCSCPPENPIAGSTETSWVLLLKPEMLDAHVSSSTSKALVSVKYPTKDKLGASAKQMHMEGGVDGMAMLDELKALRSQFSSSASASAQSMCLQLLAPLQICNVVCQPIAYRLADSEGLITSEGIILPGEVVDVHSLFQLFHSKIYLSLRMVNYCWSKWAKIFSRNSPYPSSEKLIDVTLASLDFSYQGEFLSMPAIDITISLREHFVRLSCPVVISNRTGMQLDLCEASNPDNYIPQSSRASVDMLVSVNAAFLERDRVEKVDGKISRKRPKKGTPIGRKKNFLPTMAEEDGSDDDIGRGFDVEVLEGEDKARDATSNAEEFFESHESNPEAPGRVTSRSTLRPLPVRIVKIITLVVHLPTDHLRKIEIAANSTWTLSDVFSRVASRLSTNPEYQLESMYEFFSWEDGRLGPRKAEQSPAQEADLFGRLGTSIMSSSGYAAADREATEAETTPRPSSAQEERSHSQGEKAGDEPAATASKRFATASALLSKSLTSMARRMTASSLMPTSSPAAALEPERVPPSMTFNMLVDCAQHLPMSTKVEALTTLRIRLAHVAEWAISRQAGAIVTEVVKKEGVMGSVFGRHKCTHRATFQKIEGDVPFNPHRLLSLTPSLSLRVPYQTDWSEAIDLREGGLGIGGVHISVGSTAASALEGASVLNERHCEFGAFVERGKGFFQNVTSVSIVSKHLMISELSIPLEVRQIGVEDPYMLTTLLPGSVQSFHYPTKRFPKLLQVRRTYASHFSDNESVSSAEGAVADDEDDEETVRTKPHPRSAHRIFSGKFDATSDSITTEWCGEIDISNLGIVYAKLRNPLLILKVQVEMVGASLIATFSEQSTVWPPYRLDNLSSLDVRFKQYSYTMGSIASAPNQIVSSATEKVAAAVTGSSASAKRDRRRTTVAQDGPDHKDDLFKKMMDQYVLVPTPATLETQFDILPSRSSCSYSWDYPKTGDKNIRVEFAQGAQIWEPVEINLDEVSKSKSITLRRSLPSLGNPLAEGWLMRQDVKDGEMWIPTYCILKADVFFMFHDETRSDLIGIVNLSRPGTEDGGDILLAEAVKYVNKGWDLYNSINQNIFGQSAESERAARSTAHFVDPNKTRMLLLRLADNLGVFSTLPRSLGGFMASDDEEEEGGEAMRRSVMESDSGDSGDGRQTSGGRRSESARTNKVLAEHLRAGVTVEHLFDHLSTQPLRKCDILWSMLDIGAADDEDEARDIFDILAQQTILISYSRHVDDGEDKEEPSPEAAQPSSSFHPETLYSHTVSSLSTLQSRLQSQIPSLPLLSKEEDAYSAKLRYKQKNRAKKMASQWLVRPPVLQKELMEMTSKQVPDTYSFLRPGGVMEQEEEVGFTILLGDSKHHFKCSSEMEFLGWIQACRQSIELSWVDSMRGYRDEGQSQVTMDSFKITVTLKVRADGPTKVLEIVEEEACGRDKEDKDKDKDKDKEDGAKKDEGKKEDLESIPEEAEAKADKPAEDEAGDRAAAPKKPAAYDELEDPRQALVSVSIVLQSVALSIIDSEPGEVMYLALKDIEISVERSRQRVKFAATVQQIQVSNQLLNPMFPVTLFPRPVKEKEGGGVNRLMLPGLHQRGDSYPSLHFFFQQKYHHNDKEERAIKRAQKAGKTRMSNLLYFDMATLWVAPLCLDIDEETMVRFVRVVQNIRACVRRPDMSSLAAVREEILAQQHLGTKSWGACRPAVMAVAYAAFIKSGQLPYSSYDPALKASQGIYFSLLQLHPLDIRMSFRPSPDFSCTTSELAFVSLVAQLDSARLCLNALIAEHAYGSVSIILDILAKHYQASLWRQFHKLIGSTDFVEGSVGLVANLGTGVYDLFYEPIDGLLDENSTFLTGLSKGGKSLASRTIGGTSAQVSKLASGLGKGVSMLTLDSEFQRSRTSRRMRKTHSMSEGFYVGTKELGKSLMEGFTGVVASPYQGWKEDGAAGAMQGFGKGIIGLALKPAVGVFDLASRATEGIRNTAFGMDAGERDGICRTRIPRAFGRGCLLLPFEIMEAAAQFLADKVTRFKRDVRMRIVYHQRFHRQVGHAVSRRGSTRLPDADAPPQLPFDSPLLEAWGMSGGGSYIALVSSDRIALAEVKSERGAATPDLRLIWSCPSHCIDQLFSDARGDLVLSVNKAVSVDGEITPLQPVLADLPSQNYAIMQALLEQTVGVKNARSQTLLPKSGLVQKDVFKRYSSGIKSILLSPTRHTFQLAGCALYEFTLPQKDKSAAAAAEAGSLASLAAAGATDRSSNMGTGGAALAEGTRESEYLSSEGERVPDGGGGGGGTPGSAPSSAASSVRSTPVASPQSKDVPPGPSKDKDSEAPKAESSSKKREEQPDNITRLVADLFARAPSVDVEPAPSEAAGVGAGLHTTPYSKANRPAGFLNYIYPLTDIVVTGPTPEDKMFSISFSRADGQSMRVLRRETDTEQLGEHHKSMLTLIFPRRETAMAWKVAIEAATIHHANDALRSYPVSSADAKKKLSVRQMVQRNANPSEFPPEEPVEHSIFGSVFIPTSLCDQRCTEALKIEIAKTLSNSRR